MACFLVFVYNLYEELEGICIVYKLIVVKISVGLVTVQGFIFDNLFAYGIINVPDSYSAVTTFAQQDRIRRAYCLLCLAEFVLLGYPLWYGFSGRIITSKMHIPTEPYEDTQGYAIKEEANGPLSQYTPRGSRPSMCDFFWDIVNVWRRPSGGYVQQADSVKGGRGSNDLGYALLTSARDEEDEGVRTF